MQYVVVKTIASVVNVPPITQESAADKAGPSEEVHAPAAPLAASHSRSAPNNLDIIYVPSGENETADVIPSE